MKNKPLKANIKDISAIQSNEQTKYQFTKTTNDTSKSIKNPNFNFDPLKSKIPKNETAVIYPKNINEYVHLLKNHAFTQGDLDWTLELRDEKKKKWKIPKEISFNAPSFYDNDFENYARKTKIPSTPEPFLHYDNPFKLNHLVSKNCNIINSSQINYESTLRKNKPIKGVKICKHNQEWKNLAYTPRATSTSFLPPLREKSKENLQRINKYVIRDYEHFNEKIEYEHDKIIRKTVRPNKKFAADWLGEHLEREKYNMKYKTKNVNSVRHLLHNHGNSLSGFEIGLRTFGPNDFNPLTHPKVIIKHYNPNKDERDKGIVNKKYKIKEEKKNTSF